MLWTGEGNEAKTSGSLSLPVLDKDHLRNWPEAAEVIFQSLLISVEVEPSNKELPFFRGHGSELESYENMEKGGRTVGGRQRLKKG